MPEAYKMEIFSRDYQFRSVAVLSTPTIEQDYLTLQKTSVTVHDITAQRGDYAHITSMGGSVLYQGIVEDVNVTKNGYKLKLAPLLMFLPAITGNLYRPERLKILLLGLSSKHIFAIRINCKMSLVCR